MDARRLLTIMKSQLIITLDEAIANYDKAIARIDTQEWEDYTDEYDLPISYLEKIINETVYEADKIVDRLNEEFVGLEVCANSPFDEFV